MRIRESDAPEIITQDAIPSDEIGAATTMNGADVSR
jgi:hypothetical protein